MSVSRGAGRSILALAAAALLLVHPPTGAGAEPDTVPCGTREGIEVGPRQRALVEQRRAKCGRLARYEPSFLERQILLFEKAERPRIDQLNLFGFYPRIQAVDHRSKMAAGVRFWQPDIGGSRLDLAASAFWSVAGFRFFEAQAGVVPHRGKELPTFAYRMDDVFELPSVRHDDDSRYTLYGSFTHRWAPQFDFWGLGPDSREEDHADFRLKDTLVEGLFGYRLLPRVTVSARAGYYQASPGPGTDEGLPQVEDVFAPSSLPGFLARPDFLRFGGAAVFDARDVARNPHRGGLVAAEWLRYDQRGGSGFGFDRFAADGRIYLPLGHPQRVLALRTYFSTDEPRGDGGRVPFYMQAFLGSSHTLRAYPSQRFRGERLLLFQGEYRIEASPAVEVALFAESGAVGARSEDGLGRFHSDAGVGLRLKSHEMTAVRCDLAWGGEGFRFLLRFSPSF